MRDYMQRLSARPHHVGSPYDKDNAEWILAKFKEWGLDAKIESFDVLFPTPKERALEMVEPTHFTAKLEEPAVAVDPTSNQHASSFPSYNAYSIDGDVTAPLVYVNYGIPDDYDQLDRLGISVKGAIVIARYGDSWRGIKPKVAAEHGAVGCLIYSDPHDDGYSPGDIFPEGPMRPTDGVQRGSVMDMPIYPGDPLTPGVGAMPGRQAAGLERSDHADENSRDADFLRRRAAAARGAERPSRARSLARRAADHLSRRTRAGEGSPEAEVQLGYQADLRCDRAHSGQHLSGRVDHPRQSSRCLGERRDRSDLGPGRDAGRSARPGRRCSSRDGSRSAPSSTARGMAKSRACSVPPNGPRLTPTSCSSKAAVYINSDGNGRGFLNVEGSHTLENFVNTVARDDRRSRKRR